MNLSSSVVTNGTTLVGGVDNGGELCMGGGKGYMEHLCTFSQFCCGVKPAQGKKKKVLKKKH